MKRRNFLKTGGIMAAGAGTTGGLSAERTKKENLFKSVNFIYDGVHYSPAEYSVLLNRIVEKKGISPDNYSNGGIVEELEQKFAGLLGKEAAIFMPTGTLANQIAIRTLSGGSRKAVVQEESHIYNDCGDCVQTLSGINLIPLGRGNVSFTLDDVKNVVEKSKTGRVHTEVGTISIESPVRRKNDRVFPYEEMKRISRYARAEGIKMHLDGARLFVKPAHTGIPVQKYAGLFDTVYISTYKCFNSGSGAILAGPRSVIQDLFHTRRMFGGGLPAAWMYAAVALESAGSFAEDYRNAVNKTKILFRLLEQSGHFKVGNFPDGSHIFKLKMKATDLGAFREKLQKENIFLRNPSGEFNGFLLKINPSLNRMPAEKTADMFIRSL